MYQALYRKWRPRSFDDVVGQEHITSTLKRQVQTGRLSHAYIFVGTRGTGKTSCAKILSRAVNCEHPVDGNPCNKCPSCLGIESGSILDVEELDAASNNGVDNIRDLRDEAIYTPASVKKRVYIVDEVHMLSNSAFNALLKILEEPPEHLIFILATTEIHKVPATILSRCQRFSFRRISQDKIAGRLLYVAGQEKLSLTEEGASLLARLADGSMRDALSLLDQCSSAENITPSVILDTIGLAGSAETLKLLSSINENDTFSALSIVDSLHASGKDMSAVLDELITLERDVLITKAAGENADRLYSGSFEVSALKDMAGKFSKARLISGIDTIQQALNNMAKTSNRRLAAELCVMRLCDEKLSTDISSIVSRLNTVEERLDSGAFAVSDRLSDCGNENDCNFDDFQRYDDFVPESDFDTLAPEDLPPFDIDPTPPMSAPSARPKTPAENVSPVFSPAPAQDDGGDEWADILKVCKKQVDISTYTFLSDPVHCTGIVNNNNVTVYANNPFALNMIDTPNVTKQIKDAAQQVLGRQVSVRVSDEPAPVKKTTAKNDKLDALGKFGVVFE